jgi:hypothetical protein
MSPALHAPVTWLASYPRSGNTLLRTILKRCFGQASQSIYDDADLSDSELSSLVGHETVGDDAQAFIARAAHERRNLYVKTHEMPPPDKHSSIYVVRDGRSAVVSHTHYLREILGRDITLAEVIEGKVGHSWSRHVRAWMPRPHSLLVRYEDLAAGKAATLKSISDFIGKPQLHAFDISFEALHAISPAFFRSGSDWTNILEMDGAAQRLFEQLHGETLHALGYGRERGHQAGARANA